MTTPPIKTFQLRDPGGFEIDVLNWGATWASCKVPDALHQCGQREVLLGAQTPKDFREQRMYMGATIGRFANRIFGAKIPSHALTLSPNEGHHHLHGGEIGLTHKTWEVLSHADNELVLTTTSAQGEEGYDGQLKVQVRYQLLGGSRLRIGFHAQVDAPCPLSLTNHAYFNLDGTQGSILSHQLQVPADHYLPPGPGAPLTVVDNTLFDYRQLRQVGPISANDGDAQVNLDHAFFFSGNQREVQLISSRQDLMLIIRTDLPSIQVYSGAGLVGTPARDGGVYQAFEGIAIEPQFLPDSPNRPDWHHLQESCWYDACRPYDKYIEYEFISL